MARSIDFCVDSPASVEQIHRAFSEQGYWRARIKAFGGMGKLKSLEVGSAASVAVGVVHELHPEGLPKAFAKFFPLNWQAVQEETWSPVDSGLVRGEVGIATYGAPGSGRGTALLTPVANGSQLKCTATVEFKVPLPWWQDGGCDRSVEGSAVLRDPTLHGQVDNRQHLRVRFTPELMRAS